MLREALTLERLRAMEIDDAAAWFVAQGDDGLAAQDEALLADWLAADPAHAEAFGRAGRAWGVFDKAGDDEILAAMRAHALASPARSWMAWRRMAAAAAVLAVVATGITTFIGFGRSDIETARYVAEHGQVRTIELPDGSTMVLDADSVALARIGDDERAIELERGRALFDVEKDPDNPFAVTAGTRRVVALGTQFEVDRSAKRLVVSLFEGRVRVEPVKEGTSVILAPGEQFVEADGALVKRPLGDAAEAPAGWRDGLLSFDDRPLSEAIAEVNRYAKQPVVIADPSVGAMRISGQFRAGDAERFARTVAEIHPLRVVRKEGRIELVSAR